MEDFGDLTSLFRARPHAADTSQQIFGVVDEIADSFKEQFEKAKSIRDKAPEERVAGKEKKAAGHKKQEERPVEEGEEASSGEGFAASPTNGEDLQFDIAATQVDASVEVVAVADPDPQAAAEEPELPAVEEQPLLQVEAAGDNDAAPVDDAADSEVVEVAAEHSPPIATPAAASAVAADKVPEVAQETVEQAIGNGKPHPLAERGEASEHLTKNESAVDAEVEAIEQGSIAPRALRAAARNEGDAEVAEDVEEGEAPVSHDIDTPEERVRVKIDATESERLAAGLAQLAAKTQPKPPNLQAVSERILGGLRNSNATLAHQIEAARGPTSQAGQHSPALKSIEPTPIAEKGKGEPTFTRYEQKLQQLKTRVADQVKVKMKFLADGKNGEIKLRLKPNFLGDVKVSITFEEATVKAHFVVENSSVKELLQKSSDDLQKTLKEQGIDVDTIEVDVNEDFNNSEGGKAFASAEEQRAARDWIRSFLLPGAHGSGSEPEEEERSDSSDPDQVLNIVA